MDKELVAAQDVKKVFRTGDIAVEALRGIDLEIGSGEFMAIVGPSGSGKTTLLNLIGALDVPTDGRIVLFDRDLGKLSRSERAELRLRSLGFVFQAYNLVPVLTARENVEFVLELQGMEPKKRRARAEETLTELGLGELADRRPSQMSGGQQQRVAVARAVASRPGLVLADEPTANLDSDNAQALLEMMRRLRDEMGMTFVFSTHDPSGGFVCLAGGYLARWRGAERRAQECMRLTLAVLLAAQPAFGVSLWSSADGSRYWALDTALKWTALSSHAPDAPLLYPKRWSAAALGRGRLALRGQAATESARALGLRAKGAGGVHGCGRWWGRRYIGAGKPRAVSAQTVR